MVNKEILQKFYTDPANPGGFSSKEALYNSVKAKHPAITKKEVETFLKGHRTYTLFKNRKVNYDRSSFIPTGYLSHVHVDLADFQSLSKDNDGYRFMLVAVDVLSKTFYAAPLKSKRFVDVKEALEKVFVDMPFLPSSIFSDRGLEFESREIKDYLEEKGISKFKAVASHVKAAVAERGIRTIKQKIYKFFSEVL